MLWLPNALTLARLLAAPWAAYLIFNGLYGQALILLAAAGLTDGLDGYLARRLCSITRFGAYMDPVADKLLLVTVFVSLGIAGLVPMWLVWLVVARDFLILAAAGAVLAFGSRCRFAPSVWGKLSTLVQIVTGLVALAGGAMPVQSLTAASTALPVVAAITTGWSGLHYAWRGLRPAGSSPR